MQNTQYPKESKELLHFLLEMKPQELGEFLETLGYSVFDKLFEVLQRDNFIYFIVEVFTNTTKYRNPLDILKVKYFSMFSSLDTLDTVSLMHEFIQKIHSTGVQYNFTFVLDLLKTNNTDLYSEEIRSAIIQLYKDFKFLVLIPNYVALRLSSEDFIEIFENNKLMQFLTENYFRTKGSTLEEYIEKIHLPKYGEEPVYNFSSAYLCTDEELNKYPWLYDTHEYKEPNFFASKETFKKVNTHFGTHMKYPKDKMNVQAIVKASYTMILDGKFDEEYFWYLVQETKMTNQEISELPLKDYAYDKLLGEKAKILGALFRD